MTRYLTLAQVIELHHRIMERTGARPAALRDEGLLESAMMRAQTAAKYEGADLVRQAALRAVGISQNHPFIDGNKRAAIVVLDVFLRINGIIFHGDSLALARRIEGLSVHPQRRPEETTAFEQRLRGAFSPASPGN